MPDTRLEWTDQDGVPKLVERQPQQNTGPIQCSVEAVFQPV